MVIPWVGFPLADLLKRFEPTSQAKYVQFFTLNDRTQMPGVRYPVLDWPYREGLTIAEAMHPLALRRRRPLRQGAAEPERRAAAHGPARGSTGSRAASRSSASTSRTANRKRAGTWRRRKSTASTRTSIPQVDHPRWSQATERRLGGGLFSPRIPTQMFNGYGEQVAGLYTGLDLAKNY